MANITNERRNKLGLELLGLIPECVYEDKLTEERKAAIDKRLDEIVAELDGYDDTQDPTK